MVGMLGRAVREQFRGLWSKWNTKSFRILSACVPDMSPLKNGISSKCLVRWRSFEYKGKK